MLGKDQYMEIKNDISKHLVRQAENARQYKELKLLNKKSKKKKQGKIVYEDFAGVGTDQEIK